jgi:hypothetical protein
LAGREEIDGSIEDKTKQASKMRKKTRTEEENRSLGGAI